MEQGCLQQFAAIPLLSDPVRISSPLRKDSRNTLDLSVTRRFVLWRIEGLLAAVLNDHVLQKTSSFRNIVVSDTSITQFIKCTDDCRTWAVTRQRSKKPFPT